MSTPDQIQRFVFEHSDIRGELAGLQSTYQEVLTRHDYPQPLRRLLGELLAAAALLSATIKVKGILTLQARGNGPLSLLMAEATDVGDLRAIARWDGDLPETQSLPELMGDGQLVITIDPDEGNRYQGIVSLKGETIAHCLENYFAQSEQLPTRIWLAADETVATGMLLQVLPSGQSEDPDAWDRVTHLASTLSSEELLQLGNETLLRRLFHEETLRLFDPTYLRFKCTCSRARFETALVSLGEEELQSILAEQGAIETQCQFCNTRYTFGVDDVASMLKSGTDKTSSKH